MSVEQYEALLETSARQHAVAAALASVRAEGLEPVAEAGEGLSLPFERSYGAQGERASAAVPPYEMGTMLACR